MCQPNLHVEINFSLHKAMFSVQIVQPRGKEGRIGLHLGEKTTQKVKI